MLRRMKCEIQMQNSDPNFVAVIDFISEEMLSHVQGSHSSIEATTAKVKWTRKDWIKKLLGNTAKSEPPKLDFRPSGNRLAEKLMWRGHTIYMQRWTEKPVIGGNRDHPFTPETLVLSMWGWDASTDILRQLFAEAMKKKVTAASDDVLNIFVQSSDSWLRGWELAMSVRQLVIVC
jgi:hypothetical protein